jgi:cobalamin biosynthesis Mg chelatase CobN
MSPSYQADNDAALRASLTTLLSCAAAARGLPKHNEQRTGAGAGVVPSSQPMELRLVPESELLADAPPPQPPTTPASGGAKQHQQQARTASNSSAPSAPSSSTTRRDPAENKTKRGAAAPPSRSARATKKKRTSAALLEHEAVDSAAAAPFFSSVSPTLLTWVVSAGVVVLVSVVGFGAGYVIGREVGRQEGVATSLTGGGGGAANTSAAAAASAAVGCGGVLVRSGAGGVDVGSGTLRRIRWGGVGKSVAA